MAVARWYEVQDEGHEQGYRAREVDERREARMRQNGLGIPKIAAESSHCREAMQERPAVLDRDGIIIDIYDARIRVALLCQFMHIPLRRQARPDIYELAYTPFRDKEWDDPLEELAVLQRHKWHVRCCTEYPSCGFPVRRIVVLATQVVVEYPRRIGVTKSAGSGAA